MLEDIESEGLILNFNKNPETLPSTLPKEVLIWDETLRDGEQTPGVSLTVDEKVEIAKLMDEMRIPIIDGGFPIVSEAEATAVKRMASEGLHNSSLLAAARATREDIDACVSADADEVAIFIAFSDLHLKYKLKATREQVIEKAVSSVQHARDSGLIVNFVTEDTSRTPVEESVRIFRAAIDAGASRVVIADTVGFLRPTSMRYLVKRIRETLWKEQKYKVPLSVHCHNDFGLATANTLAAIEEGVSVPHTCVGGFGERAGNAPLEEVVCALEVLYNYRTGVKTERLYELAEMVERCFSVPLGVHKAVVGQNAFSHEAGIHVHGMLAHTLCYEPISPSFVGRQTTFFLGKMTGKHIVEQRLRVAGIETTPQQIALIVEGVKQLKDSRDKGAVLKKFDHIKNGIMEVREGVDDRHFWKIVRDVTGQAVPGQPARIRL